MKRIGYNSRLSGGWFWRSRLGLSTAPNGYFISVGEISCYLGVTFWQLEAWEQLFWRFPAMLATLKTHRSGQTGLTQNSKRKFMPAKHTTHTSPNLYMLYAISIHISEWWRIHYSDTPDTYKLLHQKNIGIYHQAKEHPFLLRNEYTARWRFLLMHIIKRGLIYYLRWLRYSPFSVDNKVVDTSDGQKWLE